ncbi:MAG: TonB-dependent receptor [Flavobacteriales bacterium]|nr:TonB-dependent receptor [Flavobacteriales bacterium]|tara:strand:+ start:1013 stop:3358 length:2346 start_codon:yes stop_codon:yes gene_type:complete
MKKGSLLIILCCSFALQLIGQKFTMSGYLTDKSSGEVLIGATIYNPETYDGTTTNAFGFYSLTMDSGQVSVVFSYLGFKTVTIDTLFNKNLSLNIALEEGVEINEVVINVGKQKSISENSQMSEINVPVKQIKRMPAILGEPDLIKTLQLLPGVQSGGEGSAGFYVRGGGPDQNLILLDGAPIYNASHLFGFFSTFNPDAINNVNLIKGGFPARYGGRLSSVLDISMKEGNMKKWSAEGSIGLISSKIAVQGPIIKDKMSFIFSARRTYYDILAAPFIAATMGGNATSVFYFYDLNTKLNYKISDKDRIYFSVYNGRDKFGAKFKSSFGDEEYITRASIWWGNLTSTLRWNHIINEKLFMNTSLIYSQYKFNVGSREEINYNDYLTGNPVKETFQIDYYSGINDYAGKVDFDWIPKPNHLVKFGAGVTQHAFATGILGLVFEDSFESLDTTIGPAPINATEISAYIEDDIKVNNNLKLNLGAHLSGLYVRDKFFPSIQPRISSRYLLKNDWALKGSYSQMRQFIHLLTNERAGLPTDLWVPATDRAKPEDSWQVALGVAKPIKIKGNDLEVSVEAYYKEMNNVISYKEGASFLGLNEAWEDKVESGWGQTYGSEVFVQKKVGKLSGWFGYTLSWSNRRFNNINQGKMYPFKYDRRHDISIVMTYDLSENVSVSANWVFGSGQAISLPEYQYLVTSSSWGGTYPVGQSEHKNSYRTPNYHRLDIGMSFKKEKRWGVRTWNIGVYNAYNRWNPYFVYIDNYNGSARQVSLFPIIPSVSYGFKF